VSTFLSGVAAGYGIAIPVGAIAVLIVATGIERGLGAAMMAGAGAATADLVYATVAVVAGTAIADLIGPHETLVRWTSAAVLVAIAVTGLLGARRAVAVERIGRRRDRLRTFLRFFGLTIVNPLTVVYFASLTVGLSIATGAAAGAAFVAGAFLASLSWQWILAGAGAFAGRRITGRVRTWTAVAGNLVVVTFAVAIVLR
jgi:threonine/homoserine/homoserine lactone efflux protein